MRIRRRPSLSGTPLRSKPKKLSGEDRGAVDLFAGRCAVGEDCLGLAAQAGSDDCVRETDSAPGICLYSRPACDPLPGLQKRSDGFFPLSPKFECDQPGAICRESGLLVTLRPIPPHSLVARIFRKLRLSDLPRRLRWPDSTEPKLPQSGYRHKPCSLLYLRFKQDASY